MRLNKLKPVPGETQKELRSRQAWFEKKVEAYARFLEYDYDGDCPPILRLLIFKLKRNRDTILAGFTASKKRVAKQIDTVIALLERACEENYHEVVFKEFYEKHGHPKMVCLPPNKEGNIPVKFVYRDGNESTPEMYKEARRLYKKEGRLLQWDIDRAFRLMAKNITW